LRDNAQVQLKSQCERTYIGVTAKREQIWPASCG
jgi:hypothetical protein